MAKIKLISEELSNVLKKKNFITKKKSNTIIQRLKDTVKRARRY